MADKMTVEQALEVLSETVPSALRNRKYDEAIAVLREAVSYKICPSCERVTEIMHCQACGCDFIARTK